MSIKEEIKFPSQVLSLRLCGSVARGDADYRSDLDILAVLSNNHKPPEDQINDYIKEVFGRVGNISWYSYMRIQELYQQGHLFAWHIFQESKEITPMGKLDVINLLGKPSEYSSAYEDMASLLSILASVRNEAITRPRNAIYEAGLLYVCSKNIALVASSFCGERLDFSRYSPYNLNVESFNFPIPFEDYEILIQARHSGMRGGTIPLIKCSDLIDKQKNILKWAKEVRRYFMQS